MCEYEGNNGKKECVEIQQNTLDCMCSLGVGRGWGREKTRHIHGGACPGGVPPVHACSCELLTTFTLCPYTLELCCAILLRYIR